jgi:hypothetical protein
MKCRGSPGQREKLLVKVDLRLGRVRLSNPMLRHVFRTVPATPVHARHCLGDCRAEFKIDFHFVYSAVEKWATNLGKDFWKAVGENNDAKLFYFFNFPLYLQSVPVHSANVVKSCTKACRRVLISTLLYLIGSESSCDLGSETYKLNLKNYICNYNNYILNLIGRSIGKLGEICLNLIIDINIHRNYIKTYQN